MKTPTTFKITNDIHAFMERDGANFTGNLVVMSDNHDDYDIYRLKEGCWELEFDSLTGKAEKLGLPEAAFQNCEGWTGWLWDEVPGFAAWAEEMKALVPANEITQNDDHFVIVTNHNSHYAKTFDPSAARLIASAPDLLSALEGLLRIAEKQLDQSATHEGLLNCHALANARETLRKAKGEA